MNRFSDYSADKACKEMYTICNTQPNTEKEEDCKKRTCNNPGTATEISKKGWKRKRIS